MVGRGAGGRSGFKLLSKRKEVLARGKTRARTRTEALGQRSYLEEYVGGKVKEWISEVTLLAAFATSQPQACYAAFTFGLRHKWTYFMRTLPDIEDLLEPLERAISDVLIPSLTEHNCSVAERKLLALSARMGGLGMTNATEENGAIP